MVAERLSAKDVEIDVVLDLAPGVVTDAGDGDGWPAVHDEPR